MNVKKVMYLFVILFVVTAFDTSDILAHPGRTDGNGGHTCRTNCEKWGYEYGEYHYHNGGGSSSSSSSSSSGSSSSSSNSKPSPPKPSYTQSDVDEGTEAGREKGFEDGYERNEKSGKTDKENEGYRIGYAAGYDAGYAEGLKKIKEEETEEGQKKGRTKGKEAARSGESDEVSNNESKSDDWNTAYQESYKKAYQREKQIISVEEDGYQSGYTLDELVIPKEIEEDGELSEIYKSHYEKGYKERSDEEEENHFELGYSTGYDFIDKDTVEINKLFITSFEQGYENGLQTIKEETIESGYLSAFKSIDYEVPEGIEQAELLEWYEEGFHSNEIASEIKVRAYDNGYKNKEYFIPEEFEVNEDATALYDSLFYEGQEIKKEESQKQMLTFGSIGAGIIALSGGGFYINKRRKHRKPE